MISNGSLVLLNSYKKTLREKLEQIYFWCGVENLSTLLWIPTTNKKHKPCTVYICIRLSEDTKLLAIVSTISRKLLNLYQKNPYIDKRNMTTKICRAVHKRQDSHFNTTEVDPEKSSSIYRAVNVQSTYKATSGLCYSYFKLISMSILLPVLQKADSIFLL